MSNSSRLASTNVKRPSPGRSLRLPGGAVPGLPLAISMSQCSGPHRSGDSLLDRRAGTLRPSDHTWVNICVVAPAGRGRGGDLASRHRGCRRAACRRTGACRPPGWRAPPAPALHVGAVDRDVHAIQSERLLQRQVGHLEFRRQQPVQPLAVLRQPRLVRHRPQLAARIGRERACVVLQVGAVPANRNHTVPRRAAAATGPAARARFRRPQCDTDLRAAPDLVYSVPFEPISTKLPQGGVGPKATPPAAVSGRQGRPPRSPPAGRSDRPSSVAPPPTALRQPQCDGSPRPRPRTSGGRVAQHCTALFGPRSQRRRRAPSAATPPASRCVPRRPSAAPRRAALPSSRSHSWGSSIPGTRNHCEGHAVSRRAPAHK